MLIGRGVAGRTKRILGILAVQALHPAAAHNRYTCYAWLKAVKKLAEVGAVQEVIIEDGELRYDADMSDHGHFKCQECGKVFDLFPPANTPLVNQIHGLPEGFVVKRLHLCCRGLCQDCAGKA